MCRFMSRAPEPSKPRPHVFQALMTTRGSGLFATPGGAWIEMRMARVLTLPLPCHLNLTFHRAGWGDGGYCYVPYEYISEEHLATDPWVVKDIED